MPTPNPPQEFIHLIPGATPAAGKMITTVTVELPVISFDVDAPAKMLYVSMPKAAAITLMEALSEATK